MIKLISTAVVAVAVVIAGWHFEFGTQHNATFTVQSLDDQASGRSGHQYLVFTTNGDVYKNTDSWLHGKTDSSQVQAMLQPGRTYTCPVYGFRFFLFSSYPDILDGCKDVTPARAVRTHA
jgi:hypothetical protein